MGVIVTTWIVVLIKDFSTAKARLAPALPAIDRRTLARGNAVRALDAALHIAPTLAVCGSVEAADVAADRGVDAVLESDPRGQNAAAARGLMEAVGRGARSALLLSSDLPLVDAAGLRGVLARAAATSGELVLAVPALGRRGTNALYLRPPRDVSLCFGDASLPRFEEEARRRGRVFIVHEEESLALDLDEPSDLVVWDRMRAVA